MLYIQVYSNATASEYISGLAVHWYLNSVTGYSRLTDTHKVNPNKFILGTEACAGTNPFKPKVMLGSWERAIDYVNDIIQVTECLLVIYDLYVARVPSSLGVSRMYTT